MNVPLTLLVLNSLFASASLQAAVVGYWRFEDGAFMDDSSGNGYHLVTNTDTAQVTLPATGNGSAYPTTIPATSADNGSAAEFDGDDRLAVAYNSAFKSSAMTLEAFVTTTVTSTSGTQTIAGVWTGSGTSRVYLIGLSGNVLAYYIDGGNVSSGLPALVANNDYYVGISVDLLDATTNAITFYQRNLTTGETWTNNVAAPMATLPTGTASFAIGSTSTPSSRFTGLIDEVRLSNTKLGGGDLLIPIPEPSITMLGAMVTLVGIRRKRPA